MVTAEQQRRTRLVDGQWGLWTLLAVPLSAALGAMVVRGSPVDVGEGAVAAVLFWVALGLAFQAADLWRTFHAARDLPVDVRWGWRFEFAWRVALVVVFAASYTLRLVLGPRGFLFDANDRQMSSVLWLAVLCACSLCALGSNPRIAPPKSGPRVWRLLVGLFGASASAALAIIFWFDNSIIHLLVNCAVEGMSSRFPLGYAREFPRSTGVIRWRLVLGCLLGGGSAVLTLIVAQKFSVLAAKSRARSVTCAAMLVALSSIAVAAAAWIRAAGAPATVPWLILGMRSWALTTWLPALILLLIVASLVAWRGAREMPTENLEITSMAWRPRPSRYYHEQRWLTVLLAFAIGVHFFQAMRRHWLDDETWRRANGTAWLIKLVGNELASRCPQFILDAFAYGYDRVLVAGEVLVQDPCELLWVALFLAALRSTFARRVDEATAARNSVVALRPWRFAGLWIVAAVAGASGAIALAWLGLAIWLVWVP